MGSIPVSDPQVVTSTITMKLLLVLAVVVACASAEAYRGYGGYRGGYGGYRGKRSAEAVSEPEAAPEAEADAYYGYGGYGRGYGYGGYGGYRGYGGYGYGGYRGKRSAVAEADPNAEAEAYGYGYGRGYGYGGYGGYRGGYGGYGYGGYRGKRSAVKPGSFGHPFYSSYGHQLQWPSFRAPGFQKTVQKTAGPGGAPLRQLEEASAQPDADAYYGYGGYGYGGYRGKRSAEEEEAKPEEVKPGSFAYPFYGYDAHYEPPQIGWPGVHTPPYCFGCRGKRSAQGQQVQKTAGPGD